MFNILLKKLRSEKGLTQGQLAKAVGVSPGNVGDWETGKSKPGYQALASLTRIFDVSADFLLEINDSPVKPGIDLNAYKIDHGLTCDRIPLTEDEADLVAMYRILPPRHSEELFDLAFFKYQRFVEQKKGSIYSTYGDDKSGSADSHTANGGTA